MNIEADREGLAALLLRLRSAGLAHKDLIAAIEATPRRQFVPSQWQQSVWSDRMVPIACGETLEGVDFQAMLVAALQPAPGLRVLEVGTGSGYTAALLGRLSGRVVSVDRYRTLADQARQRIETIGLENVVIRQADGHDGLPLEGAFDRIIVWSAFETVPRHFVDQLSMNGIVVAPIGPAEERQTVARLTKVGSRFEREDIATARLQPIVRGLSAAL